MAHFLKKEKLINVKFQTGFTRGHKITCFVTTWVWVPAISCLANEAWEGQWRGSVGRTIASDTRDPWFESSQWDYYLLLTEFHLYLKTKMKKKMPGMAHLEAARECVT